MLPGPCCSAAWPMRKPPRMLSASGSTLRTNPTPSSTSAATGSAPRSSRTSTARRPTTRTPTPPRSNRPIVGLVIMQGAKKTGANKWSGTLYNRADGKSYSGHAHGQEQERRRPVGMRGRRFLQDDLVHPREMTASRCRTVRRHLAGGSAWPPGLRRIARNFVAAVRGWACYSAMRNRRRVARMGPIDCRGSGCTPSQGAREAAAARFAIPAGLWHL